jgi:hypothetical protein
MSFINLVSEEIFYSLITIYKKANQIRDEFNFNIDTHVQNAFIAVGAARSPLNDMEKHIIIMDVRKRLFGDGHN